ncbi:MAG: hypothetical protein AAF664_12140 [Planctomycetota bacterium]
MIPEEIKILAVDPRAQQPRQLQFQLENLFPDISVHVVQAFDGHRLPTPTSWTSGPGAWGCYLTHRNAILSAISRGVSRLLVFEEDALLSSRFIEHFHQFVGSLPGDAAICYLGGEHLQWLRRLPERISEFVYQPYCVNRLHAYMLFGMEMMRRIETHLQQPESWNEPHHVDHRLGTLSRVGVPGIYCPDRWMVGQAAGTSQISGRAISERFFHDAIDLVNARTDGRVTVILHGENKINQEQQSWLNKEGLVLGLEESGSTLGKRWDASQTVLSLMLDGVLSEGQAVTLCGWHELPTMLRRWASVRGHQLRLPHRHRRLAVWDTRLATCLPQTRAAWPQVNFVLLDNPIRNDEAFLACRSVAQQVRDAGMSLRVVEM